MRWNQQLNSLWLVSCELFRSRRVHLRSSVERRSSCSWTRLPDLAVWRAIHEGKKTSFGQAAGRWVKRNRGSIKRNGAKPCKAWGRRPPRPTGAAIIGEGGGEHRTLCARAAATIDRMWCAAPLSSPSNELAQSNDRIKVHILLLEIRLWEPKSLRFNFLMPSPCICHSQQCNVKFGNEYYGVSFR